MAFLDNVSLDPRALYAEYATDATIPDKNYQDTDRIWTIKLQNDQEQYHELHNVASYGVTVVTLGEVVLQREAQLRTRASVRRSARSSHVPSKTSPRPSQGLSLIHISEPTRPY